MELRQLPHGQNHHQRDPDPHREGNARQTTHVTRREIRTQRHQDQRTEPRLPRERPRLRGVDPYRCKHPKLVALSKHRGSNQILYRCMVCGLHLRTSESTVGSRKTVLETRALPAGKIQSWLDEEKKKNGDQTLLILWQEGHRLSRGFGFPQSDALPWSSGHLLCPEAGRILSHAGPKVRRLT